jgi:hypothetical protein
MKVSDVVRFRSDLFFEGAVQLLWADQNVNRADEAARTFVFHGPRYHGVGRDTGADEAYRLTDTATLAADLLGRIAGVAGQNESDNPFSLAIAGYGSGKSHFAVALTQLLRHPHSELSEQIIANLALADGAISERAKLAVQQIENSAFVVVLDGTGNFNLGNALSRAVFSSLKVAGIDDTVLRELSPRFEDAANFVSRNYGVRAKEFAAKFGDTPQEGIITALGERDEQTFALVDEIYLLANGAHIPLEGRESAQDLIGVFCEAYCGKNGPFSRLVIVFDEFGRFLEYVAERPALAGDSALQQIFQGVQDNAGCAHFVGFIQYELKAYLARLGNRDAMHIQKYITRFDVAKKYYLSSNLETIIAHLLEKPGISALDVAFGLQASHSQNMHALMSTLLPGFNQLPVWSDPVEFERVIVHGCWPLHPLATWFLTRQQDIVQSRSAITFVKNAISACADRDALTDRRPTLIPASVIVAGEMLNEMLAAERANGGVTVDNLVATLSKYDAQLDDGERSLLIAVTSAKKMRVISETRTVYDDLLAEFTGLARDECQRSVARLELDLGILAWSKELQQYEIVTDAATRGQYQKELRNKLALNKQAVRDIFVGRSKAWTDDLLQDIHPPFGQDADIPTLEWSFTAQLATDLTINTALKNAFGDWLQATKPDQPKGQVIYCYVDAGTDLVALQANVRAEIASELQRLACAAAPVWVILLADRSKRIAQYLATLYILDEGFEASERERYARFIPEERETARQGLRAVLRDAIQDRISLFAGVQVKTGRLAVEANAVFAQVYSQAVPFPMDGFSSRTGSGATDAAAMARALFGGDISGAWLAVQRVPLQNRVRSLLDHAWGLLSPDGKLKASADNTMIRGVLATLEQLHSDAPKRTLGEDLTMLLRPPYGCNLASASILLGLFVGKTLPPRAIYFDKEAISRGDWLRSAYGTTGRYIEEKALGKTTIIFLTADALTRWQIFMQEWDAEQTYRGMASRLYEAAKLRERDPLPDTLEVNFNFLREKAKSAEEKLQAHQNVLNECEKRVEGAMRSRNVAEFLVVCDKYMSRQRMMSTQSQHWTAEEVDELAANCAQVKEVVQDSVPAWTALQACNSPQQVSDFRYRMESAERILVSLGLKTLAQLVSRQMTSMIASVDQRYSYITTLNEARDLSRSPSPISSTRVREISDRIEKAERLLTVLAEARAAMQDDQSIDALVYALRAKQATWRQFRSDRREQCSLLLDARPASLQDANDLMLQLDFSRQQFSGTADEADIKERLASCFALKQFFSEIDEITGPAEQVERTLHAVFAASPYFIDNGQEPSVYEDDKDEDEAELDLAWINQCFRQYVVVRVAAAVDRSVGWTRTALAELKGLQLDSAQLLAAESLKRYDTLPTFLGATDHAMVVAELTTLRALRAALYERERSSVVRVWVESMEEQSQNSTALPKQKCLDLLAQLERHPPNLLEIELERVAGLRTLVERRLDALDISDLLGRVAAMPESKRKLLLEQLINLYQEEGV